MGETYQDLEQIYNLGKDHEKVTRLALLELDDIGRYNNLFQNSQNKIIGAGPKYLESTQVGNLTSSLTEAMNSGQNTAIFINETGRTHWVGAYIDVKNKEIIFIDPYAHNIRDYGPTYNGKTKKYDPYTTVETHFKNALKEINQKQGQEFKVKHLWRNPVQHDANNCGRLVALAMMSLDQGKKIDELQVANGLNIYEDPQQLQAYDNMILELDKSLKGEANPQNAKKVVDRWTEYQNLSNAIHEINHDIYTYPEEIDGRRSERFDERRAEYENQLLAESLGNKRVNNSRQKVSTQANKTAQVTKPAQQPNPQANLLMEAFIDSREKIINRNLEQLNKTSSEKEKNQCKQNILNVVNNIYDKTEKLLQEESHYLTVKEKEQFNERLNIITQKAQNALAQPEEKQQIVNPKTNTLPADKPIKVPEQQSAKPPKPVNASFIKEYLDAQEELINLHLEDYRKARNDDERALSEKNMLNAIIDTEEKAKTYLGEDYSGLTRKEKAEFGERLADFIGEAQDNLAKPSHQKASVETVNKDRRSMARRVKDVIKSILSRKKESRQDKETEKPISKNKGSHQDRANAESTSKKKGFDFP